MQSTKLPVLLSFYFVCFYRKPVSKTQKPVLHMYWWIDNCIFLGLSCFARDRLYQYIHGANLNSSNLTKAAPVLTSITTQSSHESNYVVRLYMSAKYGGASPQPNPELNLVLDKWRSHCIAVRKFSGFAKDDNINKEMEALVTILGKISGGKPDSIEGKGSYSIAQYNASFRQSGRLNEVWMNVSGFAAEGCPS